MQLQNFKTSLIFFIFLSNQLFAQSNGLASSSMSNDTTKGIVFLNLEVNKAPISSQPFFSHDSCKVQFRFYRWST